MRSPRFAREPDERPGQSEHEEHDDAGPQEKQQPLMPLDAPRQPLVRGRSQRKLLNGVGRILRGLNRCTMIGIASSKMPTRAVGARNVMASYLSEVPSMTKLPNDQRMSNDE